MKRILMWGVIAAASTALLAPIMRAQIAEPPADPASGVTAVYAADEAAVPLAEGGGPNPFADPVPRPAMAPMYGVLQNPGDLAPLAVRVLKGMPAEGADEESTKLAQDNAQLTAEIQQMAVLLRDANDETRGEIETKLNEKVAQQFDVRQQMRERQLAALEEQVQRLRGIHNERGMQRDRIINDRVQQLVREAQGLSWGDVGDGDAFKMSWSGDAALGLFNREIVTSRPATAVRWIGSDAQTPLEETPAPK